MATFVRHVGRCVEGAFATVCHIRPEQKRTFPMFRTLMVLGCRRSIDNNLAEVSGRGFLRNLLERYIGETGC
jgi:hypothetical protein